MSAHGLTQIIICAKNLYMLKLIHFNISYLSFFYIPDINAIYIQYRKLQIAPSRSKPNLLNPSSMCGQCPEINYHSQDRQSDVLQQVTGENEDKSFTKENFG